MFKYLFSIQNENINHITVYILGIKIHILKHSLRKKRKTLQETYSGMSIKQLPKADKDLRAIQMANLGLLKCVDKVCSENNINYWLDFGTLLGAVRHNGFIPWDDDIDIGMLRDDYEKFLKLFEKEIDSFPDLYCYLSCNNRNKCFLKIRHRKSENLFVDIFPYDLYYKKLNVFEKQELSKLIHKNIKPKWWKFFKTENQTRDYIKKVTNEKILKKNLVKKSYNPAIFFGLDFPHRWENKVYDYEQIFPLQKISFEGIEFFAPSKPKEILESIYGDYMSIPRDVYPRHTNFLDLSVEEKEIIEKMGEI